MTTTCDTPSDPVIINQEQVAATRGDRWIANKPAHAQHPYDVIVKQNVRSGPTTGGKTLTMEIGNQSMQLDRADATDHHKLPDFHCIYRPALQVLALG